MAWEKLTVSRQNSSLVSLVSLSAVWVAFVIAAAVYTDFNEPYLAFAIAGGFAFFLRLTLSRWEIYTWLLISALFIKIIHLPTVPFWMLRVACGLGVMGFGALLLLGLRVVWSEREGRVNAIALLTPSLVLIFFIVACADVLRWTSGISPMTDDAWLYAFDGSLGFQPSFVMGKIMYWSLFLTRITMLTYLSLPFAMAVVCAGHIPKAAKKVSWHMLTVLLLAGVTGWLLYNVVPGTGPLYAFGRDFPWNGLPYKDLSNFTLQKISIPLGIPRNAMPSLHVAWVVLLCWNSRTLPRVMRALLFLYLLLTVAATLGSGQHYLIDLIVALPFALAVQSAASFSLPDKSRRIVATIVGAALTVGWLVMIRFGVPLVLKSPVIPWTLVLASTAIAFWLRSWMLDPKPNESHKQTLSVLVPKLVRSAR